MAFTRFVEVGRAVLISSGPDAGKLAVIVDILDHNRAIIECPQTGVKRQVLNYKRMTLTELKVHVPRGCTSKYLKQCIDRDSTVAKWNATQTAQRMESAKKRASLNDFERFQVSRLLRAKRRVITAVKGESKQ